MPTYNGTAGNDTINGDQAGIAADIINGLGGSDTLSGLGGADTLDGGDGADILYGGAGTNILRGGNQNDSIYSDGLRDAIDGGDGNDVITFTSISSVGGVVNGGAGSDGLVLSNAHFDTNSGASSFTGFESVTGQ